MHTAREMLAGFAAAVGFGLVSAAALHFSATLRRAVYPLLVASQSVPVVAIAPVLVIYLGFGLAPKVVIVALVCFFPVTVNALDGLRSVDPEYLRVMRTLRASRAAIFRRVEVPWALPSAFTGARVAASYAAVAALFAEYAGGSSGLGETMQTATAQLDALLWWRARRWAGRARQRWRVARSSPRRLGSRREARARSRLGEAGDAMRLRAAWRSRPCSSPLACGGSRRHRTRRHART